MRFADARLEDIPGDVVIAGQVQQDWGLHLIDIVKSKAKAYLKRNREGEMELSPKEAGFAPGRLDRIADHLNRAYIDNGKIAGCQVAVTRTGISPTSSRSARWTASAARRCATTRSSASIR